MASPNWVGRLVRNWNGRVGAVVPEAGDYAAAQVTYPAPYGDVETAVQAALAGGAPATATPLAVLDDATVALTGVDAALMSGTITLPAGSNGRIKIEFGGGVRLGAFLVGTNGAQVRLEIDAQPVPKTTRLVQVRVIVGLDLEIESQEIATSAVVTGLAAGDHTITVWARKTGGASTASIIGERRLEAYSLP